MPSKISAYTSKHTKEAFWTSLVVQQWCLSTRELQLSFLGRKSIEFVMSHSHESYNGNVQNTININNRFRLLGHPGLRTKPPAKLLNSEHFATLGTNLQHSSLII